jgi:hypothetical protein
MISDLTQREDELGGNTLLIVALLPQADFVALTCPLTAETEKLIDADALSRMKGGRSRHPRSQSEVLLVPLLRWAAQILLERTHGVGRGISSQRRGMAVGALGSRAVQLAHEQRSKTVGPSASGTRAAHRRAAAVLKVAPGERLPARGHNAPV